jgi:Survival motor neuron (SMN) interacting protein 1 (SIP1)
MEKALPVTDYVAFDSSVEATGDISNMTAEQYLSWVRYQANELPDVFTAEVDSSLYTGRQTKYMPEIEEVLSCHEHLLPSVEWERDVISAFSELRALLTRLSLSTASRERKLVVPQLKDEQAWLKFCLGSEYPTEEVQRFIDPPKLISPRSPRGAMDVIEPNVDFEQRKLELSRSLEKALRTGGSMTTSTYGSYEPHGEQTESDEEDITYDIPSEPTPIEPVPVSNYVAWTGIEDSLPTTSLLLQFDQVMTQRLLSYQVSWLEDRLVAKRIPQIVK